MCGGPSYTELADSKNIITGTEIPEWVAQAGREAFTAAESVAREDYPTPPGDRVQPMSDREILGYDAFETGVTDYLPYMNNATEIASTLGAGYGGMSSEELLGGDFSLESAQPFMDIYQDSMDPAIREIEDQTLRAQNEARTRASTGGGGFGSRLGIMEGIAAGEGAKAAGDVRVGAARDGLNFAADRFDLERQGRFGADTQARQGYETDEASAIQQMTAYQKIGPMIQDLQRQASSGLITAGEAERQLDQASLDIAYASFLDEEEYDKEQINFALGALSGTPYNTLNRTYETSRAMKANPSIFGQSVAALGSLGSAYKMYENV